MSIELFHARRQVMRLKGLGGGEQEKLCIEKMKASFSIKSFNVPGNTVLIHIVLGVALARRL